MIDSSPAPAAALATQKRPPSLKPNGLKRADLERGNFIAIVPSDTRFEDVMRPNFWQHVIPSLSGGPTPRPFCRVEVVREDGTMDLELRVISTGPGMAVMRCLRRFEDNRDLDIGHAPAGADEVVSDLVMPEGYKWGYIPRGENMGHLVRLPTGDVLAQKLTSKRAAIERAIAHFQMASAEPPAK
jgi:hypothetical protein